MAAQKDEINVPWLFVIGVVTAICVLTLALLVQALYYKLDNDVNQKKNVAPVARALQQYQTEQQERLHRYSWVDKEQQLVAIPIEQAMTLTLRDLQAARQSTTRAPAAPEDPKKPAPKAN